MNDSSEPSTRPIVVLDTNAVLDWLVFQDHAVSALAQAVTSGAARWLACERMRLELERVLGYPSLVKWNPHRASVLACFDTFACMSSTPSRAAPAALRCSDADDQVFIDLALARSAKWLVSSDRALLKLARHARPLGLRIVAPRDWEPGAPASPVTPSAP